LTYSVCFFNDTATTEIYTLSLHDALPISLTHSHNHTHTHTDRHPHAYTHRRSEEHTSELQSHLNLVCRPLLEKKCTRSLPNAWILCSEDTVERSIRIRYS